MQKEPVRRDSAQVAYGAPAVDSALATNKVLRNTYMLLSLTLLFSAGTATFAVLTNAPSLGLITLVVFIGLFFLVNAVRNSIWALPAVFLLRGIYSCTASDGSRAMQPPPKGTNADVDLASD